MANLEQRLKSALADIEARDPKLARELNDKRADESLRLSRELTRDVALERMPGLRMPVGSPQDFLAETIVLRTGRPVLSVLNNAPELVFRDAESEVWRSRLTAALPQIVTAIQAVGRIEVQHHPLYDWIGTGWLVREDVVVTNRHVAAEFARRTGTRFVFRQGTRGRRMNAAVDFLEEFGRGDAREFSVLDILHLEGEGGPDLALLRVERSGSSGTLAPPIALSPHPAIDKQQVAVIGYPARDSRIPDQDLMEDIFGDVFDKKRLAPGQISRSGTAIVEHDCSTLGGNSGSVVLDLESGAAVALHFAGRFLEANYAVAAGLVARRLAGLRRPETTIAMPGTGAAAGAALSQAHDAGVASRRLTVTIPVRITVDVGDPSTGAGAPPPPAPSSTAASDDTREGEDDEEILTEARPADYVNREGYDPEFLGEGLEVPLPLAVTEPDDVLAFNFNGAMRKVLDYQHFSVAMSRRRKMCLYSAVNIDGTQPKKGKRPSWRTDPRIPEGAQTVRGCYGNPPKFSRGHMTRREDPMWGAAATASVGNADSMHLTNAVPQMQPFNAGIWLGLEDYALQNARQDDMHISVFTGPVFREDDPVQFGVQIPLTFWKVIAFVHDETGELCATGYTMSQAGFLGNEEFVFGAHKTAQVPITTVESMTGLSFGTLTAVDPLGGGVEEARPRSLTDFAQIRFV